MRIVIVAALILLGCEKKPTWPTEPTLLQSETAQVKGGVKWCYKTVWEEVQYGPFFIRVSKRVRYRCGEENSSGGGGTIRNPGGNKGVPDTTWVRVPITYPPGDTLEIISIQQSFHVQSGKGRGVVSFQIKTAQDSLEYGELCGRMNRDTMTVR